VKEDLASLGQMSRRDIDLDLIRAQWEALAAPYDVERWLIPLPPWAMRGYDHDGKTAWNVLRSDLGIESSHRPLSIYIHVPFCSQKCHFCDCYSFRLSPRREAEKRAYVNRLCSELILWSHQGNVASRPVSTVHLGGGTPTFLGPELLAELCRCCQDRFNVSADTEWALESTAQALTPEMMDTMQRIGFRRLHIGVQSLEDKVRSCIGRQSRAEVALDRIGQALALGWTVSVDLICGLPFQTIDSLARDVETLVLAGVDGFALYELLIYAQNRQWADQVGLADRSHLPNYLMFQVGAQILEHHGYRKNTFNHWANHRDDNRYFTFPSRGEDCLAVGAIADGVFGDYHFRHPRYASYLRATGESPGLEGGLRRTKFENEMHAVTTAIMSGRIPRGLSHYLQVTVDGVSLRDRWLDLGLVQDAGDGGVALLTNGSWFAGNMMRQLTALHRA